MKRIKLNLANIEGRLSREEMKGIMSGSGGDAGCSVTCNQGYYACCHNPSCNCIENGKTSDYSCRSGGKGSSSCSDDN